MAGLYHGRETTMTTRMRTLSQRSRLWEFVTSESGAMGARKAANIGAVLGA